MPLGWRGGSCGPTARRRSEPLPCPRSVLSPALSPGGVRGTVRVSRGLIRTRRNADADVWRMGACTRVRHGPSRAGAQPGKEFASADGPGVTQPPDPDDRCCSSSEIMRCLDPCGGRHRWFPGMARWTSDGPTRPGCFSWASHFKGLTSATPNLIGLANPVGLYLQMPDRSIFGFGLHLLPGKDAPADASPSDIWQVIRGSETVVDPVTNTDFPGNMILHAACQIPSSWLAMNPNLTLAAMTLSGQPIRRGAQTAPSAPSPCSPALCRQH